MQRGRQACIFSNRLLAWHPHSLPPSLPIPAISMAWRDSGVTDRLAAAGSRQPPYHTPCPLPFTPTASPLCLAVSLCACLAAASPYRRFYSLQTVPDNHSIIGFYCVCPHLPLPYHHSVVLYYSNSDWTGLVLLGSGLYFAAIWTFVWDSGAL